MKSFTKHAFFILLSASLAANASAQSTQPMLRLSTAAVVTASVVVGASPAPVTIQIYNAGGGTLNPSVLSSVPWATAAIGASTSCSAAKSGQCLPLTVTFNTTALAAGTYTGFLSISDPAAIDSPQTVSVTVTVDGYVTAAPVTLYAAPGGGMASFNFGTHSAVTTQASTASGGNWLKVELAEVGNGSYSFYFPYQATVTTQTGQGPGTYTGSVVVTGSNTAADNVTIPVTLNVTSSPIAQLSAASLTLLAGQGAQAVQTISVANAGEGSLTVSGATAAVTTGSGWLTATASSSGAVTVTANSASLSPGAYQGSVMITTNAANTASLTVPVTFLVTRQSGPLIGFGGVVDNVGRAPVAPGDIAVAYGAAFTSGGTMNASSIPLPPNLGGVQVLVNGSPVPLYFTSIGQIDFQMPYEVPPGLATVQVVDNGTPGNTVSVNIAARYPDILEQYNGAPVIVDYNTGKVLGPGISASPGDTLVVYAIGLGETTPAAVTGAAPPTSPLDLIAQPANVMLGGGFFATARIVPEFIGLAPGYAGLYQINFTIPSTFTPPDGNQVSLSLNVQGTASPPVTISIQ